MPTGAPVRSTLSDFKNILLIKKIFLITKCLTIEFIEKVLKVKVLLYQLIGNAEDPDLKFDHAVCCHLSAFSWGSLVSVIELTVPNIYTVPVDHVEEAFYDGGATFHEIFQNSPQAHKQWYLQP